MKSKLLMFATFLLMLFCCINEISAEEKTCIYVGTNGYSANAGFTSASFTFAPNANNTEALVGPARFQSIEYYDVASDNYAAGVASMGGGGILTGVALGVLGASNPLGWVLGGVSLITTAFSTSFGVGEVNTNGKVKTTRSVELEIENANCANDGCESIFITSDKKKDKVDMSSYDFVTTGECPPYLIVYVNDSRTANIHVVAGDKNLKDFIDSKVSAAPNYNFSFYGDLYSSDLTGESGEDFDPEVLSTCEGILGTRDANGNWQENTVGWLLQKIFDYMKYAVIIMIFAFSVIDYAGAITNSDESKFKKANKNLMKRIAFGIVFFVIPTLVNLILKVIDSSTCGIS